MHKIYNKFLKYVLNDEGTNEDNQKDEEIRLDNVMSDFQEYVADGSAYLYCSGTLDDLGRIVFYNSSICKLFGYTFEQFSLLNIHDLMPEIYREQHTKKVIGIIEHNKSNSVHDFKKIMSLGLNRTGYIFPCSNKVSIIKNMNNSVYLIAFIRNKHAENIKGYPVRLITDLNFYLKNVSTEAISLFGINNNNFFIKDKNPSNNEYINLISMIKELKALREDSSLIDEFSTQFNKKRVKVEDMVKFLRQSSEKNKSINIGDREESIVMNKTLDSFFEDNCEKRYKEYYIEINIIRINEKALGYDIDLEPVREETRYYPNLEIKMIADYQFFDPVKKSFYNKNDCSKEEKPKDDEISKFHF